MWSALEYAAHTRDTLDVFTQRIATTLIENKPDFVYANQGAAVVEQRYNEQDSLTVAAAISLNADALARLLKTVPAEGWERPATRRGYESFTVAGLARFALHEAHHHLDDARRSADRSS